MVSGCYLSSRGYVVPKSSLSAEELEALKKDLTVAPFTPEGYGPDENPSFKTYMESTTKLYIPKYYGLQKYGTPTINKIERGDDIDVEFTGKLRPLQEDAVKAVLQACQDSSKMGGLLCLQCGEGKCLAKDTPVLMYDGTIKFVQHIEQGDILMGDDSKPRTVLTTCTGKETMYQITPTKGEPYVVNESHILSLKSSVNYSSYLKKGDIVDISIRDFLNLPKVFHGRAGALLGYKVPIEFPTKPVKFDPYIIGYWLGDGASNCPKITTQDSTVLHYFAKTLSKHNCSLSYVSQYDYYICGSKSKGSTHKNRMLDVLKHYNLLNNKHIPHEFKCNSRDTRLQILAGIIDADGSYTGSGFDVSFTNETLMDDVIYLARSLGFAAYKAKKVTSWVYMGEKKQGIAFRTFISGKGLEMIPTKIPRKQAKVRKQIKDVLVSRISIQKLDVDTYYGFEIDGNRRFVLGDFTVTHNTVCGIKLLCDLAKKTLIVVHKEFLLDQWKERIKEFAPGAKIGLIKAKTIDIEQKDIVIASLQSLAMKNYEPHVLASFGALLLDECHHLGAHVFSQALKKCNFTYTIGLTATPKRKDGLTKVFTWFIGDIVYQTKKRKDELTVCFKEYYNADPTYSKEHVLWNKKPNMSRMINAICEFVPRVVFIVEEITSILKKEPNRRLLLLSDRRQHLHMLKEHLDVAKLESGFYYGGMTAAQLKESEDKQILLATYQYASEGFDMKGLDTLILASPKSDVIQVVGRILRDKPEDRKHTPLVIDVVDDFSMFPKQAKKRYTYYKSCKYAIDGDLFAPVKKATISLKGQCHIQDE
jgi:superfamily II DNA or RNA helicase